jgi:hypothetical protein
VNTTTWVASNPLQDPSTWHATTGIDGVVKVAQAGIDGKFVVSTDQGIFHALNSDDFNLGDSTPVNDLAWEGLDGVYVGLKDSSVTKTTDGGRTQGDLVPSADFSNEDQWADCAVGHQIAIGVVPRDDDEGNWPAPNSTPTRATHWVSPGFTPSLPGNCAGIGISQSSPLTGVVDLTAIHIGSITYRITPTDDLGTRTDHYWLLNFTGPAPSATGLSAFSFVANGALTSDHLAAAFFSDVIEKVYNDAGVPGHLATGAGSLPAPNDKYAGIAEFGENFLNTTNGVHTAWGGGALVIGPQTGGAVKNENDFSGYGVFPPHIFGQAWVAAATLQILVFP